jgi:hypothetical protein
MSTSLCFFSLSISCANVLVPFFVFFCVRLLLVLVVVVRVVCNVMFQELVLKELKHGHSHRAAFMNEVNLLKSLAHPNILEYVGIFCLDRKVRVLVLLNCSACRSC